MDLTMQPPSRQAPQRPVLAQNGPDEKGREAPLMADRERGRVVVVAFAPPTTRSSLDTPFAEVERVVLGAFRGALGSGVRSREVIAIRATTYLAVGKAVASRSTVRRSFRAVAVVLGEVVRDFDLDAIVLRIGERTLVFATASRHAGEGA